MTRSILISAGPEEVWPWVAQLGQNRGGFYSHAWLENLAGASIANADSIVDEFQIRAPGELVTIHPRQPPFRAVEVEAPWALVLWGSEGLITRTSWALLLETHEGQTRLTARMRIDRGDLNAIRAVAQRLFLNVLLRPGHALMERGMLLGIRRRCERS